MHLKTLDRRAALRLRMARKGLFIAMACILGLLGLSGITARPAAAAPPSIAGYATNFDVPNGTDKECEGFEVDIEDVTDTQITYTWPGSPGYTNPYGSATPSNIVNTVFPDGHSGVRIKFVAAYAGGAWSAKTPIGTVNHFGVHITANPGVQHYTWLSDLGGSSVGSTGTLTEYGGTTQGNFYPIPSVPSIVPGIVSTPTGEGVQPVVVPAETTQPAEPRFPDAVWVNKYEAPSTNVVGVDQLLITDPEVQNAITNSQISSIAELFQPDPLTNGGAETEPADLMKPGDQSSVTVTETYRYTGPVDPIDNSVTCNEIVGDPNNCKNFVGTLIARQMQSTQLAPVTPRAPLNVAVHTGTALSGVGGNVTSGPLPGNANPANIDCGSHGGSCFTNVDNPTSATLTATPNAGYDFLDWSGACSGTAPVCVVTVTASKLVSATFVLHVSPTSLNPSKLPRRTAKTVTVTGSGFLAGATLSVSGTGVSVGAAVVSGTQIKATLTVSSTAALGPRDLSVTNLNGHSGSCSGCLTVYSPAISAVTPNTIGVGVAKRVITLDGSNFVSGAKVVVSGTEVKAKATFVSASQLQLAVAASSTATTGPRDVTVTNPDGGTTSCVGCLTVDPLPTLSSAAPGSLARGTTGLVAPSGTNFSPGATVGVQAPESPWARSPTSVRARSTCPWQSRPPP